MSCEMRSMITSYCLGSSIRIPPILTNSARTPSTPMELIFSTTAGGNVFSIPKMIPILFMANSCPPWDAALPAALPSCPPLTAQALFKLVDGGSERAQFRARFRSRVAKHLEARDAGGLHQLLHMPLRHRTDHVGQGRRLVPIRLYQLVRLAVPAQIPFITQGARFLARSRRRRLHRLLKGRQLPFVNVERDQEIHRWVRHAASVVLPLCLSYTAPSCRPPATSHKPTQPTTNG